MKKSVIVFLCLTVIFSCSRAKKSQSTEKPLKSPVVASTNKEKNQKIVLKRNKTVETVQNIGPGSILKYILPLKTESNIYPQDFKIGKLEPEIGIPRTDKNIVLTIKTFLNSLQRGKVDRVTIDPEDFDSIKKISTYYFNKANRFNSFRIGSINSTGMDTVTVNCRLFGSPGTAEGQIYLKRKANKWLITNVQINIKQITKPRKKELFIPNSYSWIMEE